MWTKLQLIDKAFKALGLGSAFNIGAAELQDALSDLDSMMAAWKGVGLDLGYALPANPDASSTGTPSGLPDDANEAVYLSLALKLAPGFGKTPTPEMKAAARSGYSALLRRAVQPIEQQMPNTLPRGAGNKPWRGNAFFPTPTDTPNDDGAPLTP